MRWILFNGKALSSIKLSRGNFHVDLPHTQSDIVHMWACLCQLKKYAPNAQLFAFVNASICTLHIIRRKLHHIAVHLIVFALSDVNHASIWRSTNLERSDCLLGFSVYVFVFVSLCV